MSEQHATEDATLIPGVLVRIRTVAAWTLLALCLVGLAKYVVSFFTGGF
jgi:hypothetical protein